MNWEGCKRNLYYLSSRYFAWSTWRCWSQLRKTSFETVVPRNEIWISELLNTTK